MLKKRYVEALIQYLEGEATEANGYAGPTATAKRFDLLLKAGANQQRYGGDSSWELFVHHAEELRDAAIAEGSHPRHCGRTWSTRSSSTPTSRDSAAGLRRDMAFLLKRLIKRIE